MMLFVGIKLVTTKISAKGFNFLLKRAHAGENICAHKTHGQ